MTPGTADFVTKITFTRRANFGGFEALQTTQDGAIFVRAVQWKGVQPRLVLRHGDAGYADWAALLEVAPSISETHSFVGAAEAARNPIDQWLTHGPSKLLV